jgi:catechol 2,3-dioxygenase-like lactoylglutathione lyase family enzyme
VSLLTEVALAVDAGPWMRLGVSVHANRAQFGRVRVRFGAAQHGLGLAILHDRGLPHRIDGVPTYNEDVPATEPPPNGLNAIQIDHVVLATPDLARTVEAFEQALRTTVRRVRTDPTGSGARLHQAFFRLGETILEVVGPPEVDPKYAEEPAQLNGIVLSVLDLDDVCARLGPDVVSAPKNAVQPGRRIATIRKSAGLGHPVALLSA